MSVLDELRAGVATDSATLTQALAARVAAALPATATLALRGDLGAGKSTFVRGLAAAWNIAGPIPSPTYNLLLLHRGDRLLAHVDAYRLPGPEAFDGLLLDDLLTPPWCLAVEWPDRVREALPAATIWLEFTVIAPGHHRIQRIDPPPLD